MGPDMYISEAIVHSCKRRYMNSTRHLLLNTARFFLAVVLFCSSILLPLFPVSGQDNRPSLYVGSEACETCHQKEYARFIQYAKKSKSYQSSFI